MNEKVAGSRVSTEAWAWTQILIEKQVHHHLSPQVHLTPRAHHQKLVAGNFIMKVVDFLSPTKFSFLMRLTPVNGTMVGIFIFRLANLGATLFRKGFHCSPLVENKVAFVNMMLDY